MAERPEDFNLPESVVTKLLKESLPDNIPVSKEARAALARAASIFVLYSTSLSNNFANKGKRKMVSGQDVIAAMEDMELGAFRPQLEEALETFRRDKSAKKDKKKAKDELREGATEGGTNDDKTRDVDNDDDERLDEVHSDGEEMTAATAGGGEDDDDD